MHDVARQHDLDIAQRLLQQPLGFSRRKPHVAKLRSGAAALADELDQDRVARRCRGKRHIGTGCVQQTKRRKLVVNPGAELDGTAKPALVPNGARGPRTGYDAPLLINGRIAETASFFDL